MFKTLLTTIMGAIVFQTGVLAQIYVKSTGVGIGISTPTQKLHLSGKMLIEGAGDDVLTFNNTSNIGWQYISYKRNSVRHVWMGLNNGNEFYLTKESSGNIVLNPADGKVVIESASPDNSIGGSLILRHLGKGAGASREWAIYNMSGAYGSSLQFWAYDNIGCAPGGMCFSALTLKDNGNIGIGTNSPGYKLDVIGGAKASMLDINSGTEDGGRLIFRSEGHPEWRVRNANGLGFFPGEGAPTSLWLDNSGTVGIGVQDTEGHKLKVAGNVRATSFIANGNTWADYVFDSTYQLPSLHTLEAYIRQNHHLPEVPSAEDVKKEGISLGDNQVVLLKKIEELTLYVIDQNKKIQEQNSVQNAQNERLALLEKKLNEVLTENNKLQEQLQVIKK